MKKIIYRILLISLFIICIFNIKSFGASDFSYTLDANGNATITAYNGTESNLTIPNEIDGHKVIAIGAHAFDESRNSTNGDIIKNLVISEGITKIDGWAFCECENLESVKLPESLITLDWQIFLGCTKLVEINIPHKLTILNNGFLEQTAIKEITIPENIQKFISSEFRLCKSLKEVFIYNDNIEYYHNGYDTNVFEGCDSIILYGNEGSTTQEYAQQKGIQFKLLSSIDEPPVTTMGAIELNKEELKLKENESETLEVSFIEILSSTKVLWSSSDENIAIVENGKVTAKNNGNAIITVSTEDGKYKDTCAVSVTKEDEGEQRYPVTTMGAIKLNKEELKLKENESVTLEVSFIEILSSTKVIWSSSDENVAIVENGKVTAKNKGDAIITVSTEDGKYKDTCAISVTKETYKDNNKDSEDNTQATGKLPQTGEKMTIIAVILYVIIISIIAYKKYYNFKNVR